MAGTDDMARDPEPRMKDNSHSPPRKSGLMLRVLSALVMLPVAVFIILQGGLLFCLFVAMVSLLVLYEWNGICEAKPFNAAFVFQSLLVLSFLYSIYSGIYFYDYVYLAIFGLLVAAALFMKLKVHFALLGVVYILIPAMSLIWMRISFDPGADRGGWLVLWMMIVVWSMDTGAYFAGKNIGGPKMAPKISPNKTWAGLIGGAVSAVILGGVAAYYFDLGSMNAGWSWPVLLSVAAIIALWSQIGDLAESALKRHFDVKDSGAIIPGHGGILDRVDGVLFAAPAMALFVSL